MSRPTSRFLLLPVISLVAALGLVACGSDNNDKSSSNTSSTDIASVSSGDTASTDTGATSTTGTSGDALEELFFTTVRQQIEKQGLSPEVASCVEQKLRESVTQEELDQLKSGKQPSSLSSKATDAGASCAQSAISGK